MASFERNSVNPEAYGSVQAQPLISSGAGNSARADAEDKREWSHSQLEHWSTWEYRFKFVALLKYSN